MGGLKVLLADSRPVRSQRLRTELLTLRELSLAGVSGSLMEMYSTVESGQIEVVIVCDSFCGQPEYRMFADLAALLGVTILTLPATANTLGSLAETLRTLAGKPRPSADQARLRAAAQPPAVLQAGAPISAQDPIIVLGASTGGVEALHRVLANFPEDCPATLVVQHIRGNFSAAFADRLNRACRPTVVEAVDGQSLVRGTILVAPGDEQHLQLRPKSSVCRLVEAPPVTGHRPSVDALFLSAAPYGARVVAALLTGMGQDGARGLLAIRRAGGHTIAQDSDTSTVYGMPRVAAELDAACEILPLDRISSAILRATNRSRDRSIA